MTVNGAVITELGSKADIERDHIKVDGKLLRPTASTMSSSALNKPRNYVTTVPDPERRPTVMDLIQGVKERVYPVGRLDYHSEGLLLLTNDGELANVLSSAAQPRSEDVSGQGQLARCRRAGRAVSARRAAVAAGALRRRA